MTHSTLVWDCYNVFPILELFRTLVQLPLTCIRPFCDLLELQSEHYCYYVKAYTRIHIQVSRYAAVM